MLSGRLAASKSMARRKAGIFQMPKYLLLYLVVLVCPTWANETPVERSSHPRGFVSGGALPPMTAANGAKSLSGSGVLQDATIQLEKPSQPVGKTPVGRVSGTGATRIDARVQTGTASAIGDQNSAANQTGSIGGK